MDALAKAGVDKNDLKKAFLTAFEYIPVRPPSESNSLCAPRNGSIFRTPYELDGLRKWCETNFPRPESSANHQISSSDETKLSKRQIFSQKKQNKRKIIN